MRVLLIEDSIRLQQTIGAALRRSGCAVDVSGDGEDGLWRTENNDYDAIVLDIMLPRLDGLALLQRLRARGKATHVLLLTARDTVPDRVRGLRAGADDYLVKPFALEELLARVEAHLYNDDAEPMSNVVESILSSLRRKLSEPNPAPIIHTRRGLGYPPAGTRVTDGTPTFTRDFRQQTNETLNNMKTHLRHLANSIAIIAAVVLAAGCATEQSQAELQAKAKITQAQAQETALARAPGGTVKEAELEEEHGRLVWAFDIATPGAKDPTEVLVDALTGEIVATGKKTKSSEMWMETIAMTDEPLAASGRNRFFILEPGYQLVLEGKEDGKVVNLTITVLDDTKQVGGVQTRVVEERESAGGKLVEVSRNYFAIGTQTRNVYYFGEDVDIHKGDKIVHEGAWLAGVNDAKHGIAMPGEIQIGAKYHQEKAPKVAMDRAENVSFSETIETPAGTFKNCLKVKETTPLESGTEHKIYAPEVGLVQDGSLRLVQYRFVKK